MDLSQLSLLASIAVLLFYSAGSAKYVNFQPWATFRVLMGSQFVTFHNRCERAWVALFRTFSPEAIFSELQNIYFLQNCAFQLQTVLLLYVVGGYRFICR